MRRTLVIVLATAIVGGLAGASIGLAFNKGGSTTSSQPATLPRPPERSGASTRSRSTAAIRPVSS